MLTQGHYLLQRKFVVKLKCDQQAIFPSVFQVGGRNPK